MAWVSLGACQATPGPTGAPPAGHLAREGPYPVLRVVDGDTLWIKRSGKLEVLRLQAVDTEERAWESKHGAPGARAALATDFGQETADWAAAYLGTSPRGAEPLQVQLVTPPTGPLRDAYDRLLCHVFLPDGVHFNLLLVELGKSPYYTKYGHSFLEHEAFRKAEQAARRARRGIWSAAHRARPRAPDYSRLRPWWTARAAALSDFQRRQRRGEAILAAGDGAALQRALDRQAPPAGARVTVFGYVERFFEEPDGSLTARMESREAERALRFSLPAELRGGALEKTLRDSKLPFKQNYLYLSGRLLRVERGLQLLADADSIGALAGPEP